MVLAAVFAAVALFLAAIGIYGVLAYLVAQRRKELGIRFALGGTARTIFTLVLGEGLRLVGAGFVLGVAGAAMLGRAMRSQLYAVGSFDPAVISIVIVMLGTVAVVACLVPAGRALRGFSPFAAAIFHAVTVRSRPGRLRPMPVKLPLDAHFEDTPHGHYRGLPRLVYHHLRVIG